MSTPVCIANAIADALNISDVQLPATPSRLNAIMSGEEKAAPASARIEIQNPAGGSALRGGGQFDVQAAPEEIWEALLNPESLKVIIPGCHSVSVVSDNFYRAEVSLGVGPIKGKFSADVHLSNLRTNEFAKLSGALRGPLGDSEGAGEVTLTSYEGGTRVSYQYTVSVSGKVAAVGGRMLDRAANLVIGQFFEKLASTVTKSPTNKSGFVDRTLEMIRSLIGQRQ